MSFGPSWAEKGRSPAAGPDNPSAADGQGE
jgi:hypothetical protein